MHGLKPLRFWLPLKEAKKMFLNVISIARNHLFCSAKRNVQIQQIIKTYLRSNYQLNVTQNVSM